MTTTKFLRPQTLLGVLVCLCGLYAHTHAQSPANYGQQIAVLKMLNQDLKCIGFLGSTLSDANVQDITRAGLSQGLQVVVGRPKDAREISEIYKKMLKEKSVQMIIIPDARDELMLGVGFEYLKSTALLDKVGVCVPVTNLVTAGAFCSVQRESGKIVVYCNNRVSEVLGASIPNDPESSVTFVSR